MIREALDLLLTWIRIPFPLLRQTAWLLTAATIAFNGAAAWPDPLGVGMHGVIPILFVVTVEAARHAVGRIADITADRHMEGVRITRWLLSPVPTFKLWRRMKLWELRSYEQAVGMEQDRLIYQARLQARYGRLWRRRAPVEALMPLRLARIGVPLSQTGPSGLAAAGIEPALIPAKDALPGAPKEALDTAEAPDVSTLAQAPQPISPEALTAVHSAGLLTPEVIQAVRAAGVLAPEPEPAAVREIVPQPQVPGTPDAPGQMAAQPTTTAAPQVPHVAATQAQPFLVPQAPPVHQVPGAPAAQDVAAGQGYAGHGQLHPGAGHHPVNYAVLPEQMPAPHASPWFAAPNAAMGPMAPNAPEAAPPAPGPRRDDQPAPEAPARGGEAQIPSQRTEERGPVEQEPAAAESTAEETAEEAAEEALFQEAAYAVFHAYVDEHSSIPTPEQLDIYLADRHGVTHPRSASLLRRMLPELKARDQAEREAEHIA
ncbi:DUF2637 domain-containing protein [Streptomyces sp. NPDC006879]|uniref:DUF2637 domain-containing protein n=1 Tax=Streptomyces sp. NPDC006879 TaxID=3364767 RepID=UPI0036B6318B